MQESPITKRNPQQPGPHAANAEGRSILIDAQDLYRLQSAAAPTDSNKSGNNGKSHAESARNSTLYPEEQPFSGNSCAKNLIIVDIGKPEDFIQAHIPGARPLEYAAIVRSSGKVGGLLPTAESLATVLAQLGIGGTGDKSVENITIVAYDRQGGSAAARFIWTLHAFGLFNCSLLNGGLDAWVGAGLPTGSGDAKPLPAIPGPPKLVAERQVVVNTDELLVLFEQGIKPVLLDARSDGEYKGEDVRSERGGHIPGARWLEWTTAIDKDNHRKLLPDSELHKLVTDAGFKKDDTVIAYCQTHQRSSLSYVMLKHLGFDNVKGLEGAWSEWGNREDTPVET